MCPVYLNVAYLNMTLEYEISDIYFGLVFLCTFLSVDWLTDWLIYFAVQSGVQPISMSRLRPRPERRHSCVSGARAEPRRHRSHIRPLRTPPWEVSELMYKGYLFKCIRPNYRITGSLREKNDCLQSAHYFRFFTIWFDRTKQLQIFLWLILFS